MSRRGYASLSGAWSGAFRYPRNAGPETVFNVQIVEIGSSISGTLQEPNVLRPGLGSVVTARIDGLREGSQVNFTKRYDGSGGMDHAVAYEGTVDGRLTRIDGRWIIPGVWSGTFLMTRDDDGAAEAIEREVEATIGAEKL